ASDRAAICAGLQPPQSAVDRGQPVPQASRDGAVDALGGKRLGRVGEVPHFALGRLVLPHRRLGRPEQRSHAGALGGQQLPCPVLGHAPPMLSCSDAVYPSILAWSSARPLTSTQFMPLTATITRSIPVQLRQRTTVPGACR